MPRKVNLLNRRMGRWLVLSENKCRKNGQVWWNVVCHGSNENPHKPVYKKVGSRALISGDSKSCGCFESENKSIMGKNNRTHGHTIGVKPTSEYRVWQKIKERCFDPERQHYERYGGRGITMYEPWVKSFELFYEYVGPRPSSNHSINRIDNDGNYEPGNVEWTTQKFQARNRSTTKLNEDRVRRIKYDLKSRKAVDLAYMFNVSEGTIYDIWAGRTWGDV